MNVTFFDRDDAANHFNGTLISNDDTLLRILMLQSKQDRPPFFCELVGENGFCLLVGIGRIGCAQYSRSDGEVPYLMAVANERSPKGGCIEFLFQGIPTDVRAGFCVSFPIVLEIAKYFRETGGAYPAISWEKI
jgi:hypothetical protein